MSLLSAIGCRGCEICSLDPQKNVLATPKMKPTGDPNPDLYILGDFPAPEDDSSGMQFNSNEGQMFRQLLPHGLNIRLSNLVRCLPPSQRLPTPSEYSACAIYTEEDLMLHPPKVLVLAGASALKWACGATNLITWRGIPFPLSVGNHQFWCIPVLSPAFVMRHGGDSWGNPTYTLLKKDLELATSMINVPCKIAPLPSIKVEIVRKFTDQLISQFMNAPALGIDIETDSLTPWQCRYGILSVAISSSDRTIAFTIHHPSNLHPENSAQLKKLLSQYKGKIVAHNTAFELSWFFHEYGPETVLANADWHDSMCALRLVNDRESPKSLDDGCRIYLGSRVKNITGVKPTQWRQVDLSLFLRYNGIDAWASLELITQLGQFENEDLEYHRLREAVIATALMSHTGLSIDLATTKQLEREIADKIRDENQAIRALPDVQAWEKEKGKPFDALSPAQVGDFFESIHLLNPGSGTDESILRGLTHPAAAVILNLRRQAKLMSTYLSSWQKLIGDDGKLHPRYTVCHVATGRLSSEGPNIQNVPKHKDKIIRKCIKAPHGYELLSLDFSQIELRVLAMMADDRVLIQELWAGTDLHQTWSNRVVELYPEILGRIATEYELDDEKAIMKTLRYEIKRGITFALPYGSSRENPGRLLHLPREISWQISDEYWAHYPGIKRWQKRCRQFYQDNGYVVMPYSPRRRTGILEGNEPINTPIQGTAADFVISAMIRLAKRAQQTNKIAFMPCINIHDDLTFLIPEGEHKEYGTTIGKEMVAINHPMVNIPLTVEATHGPDWYHQETFATYSSTEFGHRRSRKRATTPSKVSPEVLFGGSWARLSSSST